MKEFRWHTKMHLGLALCLIAIMLVTAAMPALHVLADSAYHTEHIQLRAVGDAPLDYGFVNNIHPDGPEVYAHEIYELKGALPHASYEVFLMVYVADTTCSSQVVRIPTARLSTNEDGNGQAQFFLPPAGVPSAWRASTHGIRWEIEHNGSVVYDTVCIAVALD